jgi:hypothetical protein
MTYREAAPADGPDDVFTRLAALDIPMEPVSRSRRLIKAHVPGHPLIEFMSPDYDMRILAAPEGSSDARWRAHLAANNVPVPQQVGSEADIGLWLIPPGTRTVGDSAHLIADNPDKYGRLLRVVGEAHRAVYDAGLGGIAPVEGVNILDRFAFAPDVRSPEGVSAFLLPPYEFNPDARRNDFAHQIIDELAAIPDMFERRRLMQLGQQLQEGGGGV